MEQTVGIDLRCLPVDGSAGAGVAHATRFLTEALLRQDVPWTWRTYTPQGASFSYGDAVGLRDVSGASLRSSLRSHPCDLLFVPQGSIPPFLNVPTCPWVHDLFIFDHPEWFPQSWFQRLRTTSLFRYGVHSASIVFAVSEDTKQALMKRFALPDSRILVTWEGGDPVLAEKSEHRQQSKGKFVGQSFFKAEVGVPYLLFVGTIEPRKNLEFLIEMWRRVAAESERPLDLVIVGRIGWKTQTILSRMQTERIQPNGSRLHHFQNIDDEERRMLLLGAKACVVPSWCEGFGLSALEAMQAKIPLISSNGGALAEVVGEGGALLDPEDQNGWVEVLRRVMTDDEFCEELRMGAEKQAEKFSWDKTATVICHGLKKVLRQDK